MALISSLKIVVLALRAFPSSLRKLKSLLFTLKLFYRIIGLLQKVLSYFVG